MMGVNAEHINDARVQIIELIIQKQELHHRGSCILRKSLLMSDYQEFDSSKGLQRPLHTYLGKSFARYDKPILHISGSRA